MPTPTYTPLANITLTGTPTVVTFSSISQAYRDLVVVYNGETVSSGGYDITLKLNGDTSNHSVVVMGGDGSSTFSFTATTNNLWNLGSGNKSAAMFQIMDYTATDKHKTSLVRMGSAAGSTGAAAQRWASTSAVTSVAIGIGSGTFAVGSTFALFGVAA
jgi:hypothetical protein